MFEALLKMNESASRLNQSFEIICVGRFGLEPNLLQNVMRLVITFFIPAMEKRAIKRMLCDVALVWIGIFGTQLGHKLRNPLAFVHEVLNLLAAQIMSKPARTIFPEKQSLPRPAVGFSLQAWLCQHKK
jgi:hypothetical protein